MSRLRVVVAGAGRAAQLVHLPHLLAERERFRLVGVADPAPVARAEVAARFGLDGAVFAAVDDLLELDADALICATPVPFHAPVTRDALAAGLHVLCEKPVAFTLREHDELIAARDCAGCVVQVGYMKRFDPAYRRLLELLPDDSGDLVYLGVDVNDPQERPFTTHSIARDAGVLERVRELEASQIREDVGEPLADDAYRSYRHGYLSSLVHDVNLVHGILQALGHRLPAQVIDGAFWADAGAVSLALALDTGGRVEARHVALPHVAAYRERLRLLCRDRILDLTFPSPYLPRRPARLVEQRTSGGVGVTTTAHHVSFADRVRLQLLAFHASVTADADPQNSLEEARLDLEVLRAAHRLARRRSEERHDAARAVHAALTSTTA